jgi:hypothetical protein
MRSEPETDLDRLWNEYRQVFEDFDDLTLARWMAQTLGQFAGRCWRTSHPLAGAYRLAAQTAHQREIWFKRLVTIPSTYLESPCCRAPLLPLLTRDVGRDGLICPHCDSTLVALEDLPGDISKRLDAWASEYADVHAVAHWDERQQKASGNYENAYNGAARQAITLLALAGREIAPALLDTYAAVFWEDQDECLEVRPEDISLKG